MSTYKDFYAKDVPDAIEKACTELGLAQEELAIEVLETGSAGIFGLCRKKAHIRVSVKEKRQSTKAPKKESSHPADAEDKGAGGRERKRSGPAASVTEHETPAKDSQAEVRQTQPASDDIPEHGEQAPGKDESIPTEDTRSSSQGGESGQEAVQLDQQTLDKIRGTVERLCSLMGFPGTVTVNQNQAVLDCRIAGEHEDALTGEEGRTLDSMQYLVRKMLIRELPEQLVLNLDAGNYRTRRLEELKAKALLLAAEVKEHGKTQSIPALSPSERREIHMLLQEDREVQSRSVGDGLFKKILIFKPGKGQRPGSRNRRKDLPERDNDKE